MEVISKNKKAFFEYNILDKYNAGLVLVSSEIKPIRAGKVSIAEAYCYIADGEAFIKGMHIQESKEAGVYDNHTPTRLRKLLLNKKEIRRIEIALNEKGMTLVPLSLKLTATGLIKLTIGLGKGKKLYDKRESIKKRDTDRDLERTIK